MFMDQIETNLEKKMNRSWQPTQTLKQLHQVTIRGGLVTLQHRNYHFHNHITTILVKNQTLCWPITMLTRYLPLIEFISVFYNTWKNTINIIYPDKNKCDLLPTTANHSQCKNELSASSNHMSLTTVLLSLLTTITQTIILLNYIFLYLLSTTPPKMRQYVLNTVYTTIRASIKGLNAKIYSLQPYSIFSDNH